MIIQKQKMDSKEFMSGSLKFKILNLKLELFENIIITRVLLAFFYIQNLFK